MGTCRTPSSTAAKVEREKHMIALEGSEIPGPTRAGARFAANTCLRLLDLPIGRP